MNTTLTDRSDADLLEASFHRLKVQDLLALCNPFETFQSAGQEIGRDEVLECLAAGDEFMTHTPVWYENARARNPVSEGEMRRRHVRKIAYFVKHKANEPISIDVGVPSLGHHFNHLVDDGNHRFAAAIIREDTTICVKVGGELEYARELGLWNPNGAEKELCRRSGTPVSPKRSARRVR